MIGVHPAARCGDLLDVDLSPDTPAEIADIHTVRAPLCRGILPKFPNLKDAIQAPVGPAAEVRVGAGTALGEIRAELCAIRSAAMVAVAHRA